MPETQLYSVADAATVLGISERTVWSMVYKRELASVRVGHLRKIHKKEIDRYIELKTIPARRAS